MRLLPLLLLPMVLSGCDVIVTSKAVLRSAANDLYTIIMVSITIYAMSFMCQSFERQLIKTMVIVIAVDGVMQIISYILGA